MKSSSTSVGTGSKRGTALRTIIVSFSFLMFSNSELFPQSSVIHGIVLDSLSGEPLVGANVLIAGTSRGTTTDEGGQFLLGALNRGIVVLRFTMVGYRGIEQAVTVESGDSLSLRILLMQDHLESEIVVITGTRTVRSIDDVPVRVEAIPEEEVEEKLLMTPSSVAMLLNESTGMRVQSTSAATGTANLRIQGLSGDYTQILNDAMPSLGGMSAGLTLTQLAPLDVRQVEILKGAISSIYGADAISGVVNFLPKIPGESPELSLLLNGTTQSGLDAAGFYSEQFERTGVSFLASHNIQPRHDVDGDGFADVAEFTRTTLTPRLKYRFSDDVSLRLGFSAFEEDRIGGAMDETPEPGSSSLPYTEEIRTHRYEASSQVDWKISPEKSLAIKLGLARSKRDSQFGTSPFMGVYTMSFVEGQYAVESGSHNLLFGSAFRADDFDDQTPGIATDRSYRYTIPSLFVQDELRASEQFSFVLSGRLDFHNTFGTFFIPRLSLMYRPQASLTFRLGGGTGYKAPTIFMEEAEEVGFRNVRPIVDVEPVRAQSVSADVNWRNGVGALGMDLNAAVFLTSLEGAIMADQDSLTNDVVHFRNSSGRTSAVGAELSLRLSYHDLKASFGYTYVYASEERNGIRSECDLNPRHSLGLVVVWESNSEQLKLGLENYWTGPQRVEENPFRTVTPSYWITGFIAEKGFGNFRFFVNCENIFDTRQTKYEPIFVGDLAGGNVETLPVYAPLEGRAINGGIRYVVR